MTAINDDGSLIKCDRCGKQITYEKSHSWYKDTSWRSVWSAYNPQGASMPCKELRDNDYCSECVVEVNKYVIQIFDILFLKREVSKLERAINERNKNYRAA